jgi:phosphatidate phosphatase APP1
VVTGWPIQFAPRLVRFLEKNGYPPMALFLRNLGRSTLSGYKEPVLRRLAARFPQPLILIGDSGERDPEIYAELAREAPGRVLRIYIREADVIGPMSRFNGMLLFADPEEAVRDAQELGLGR